MGAIDLLLNPTHKRPTVPFGTPIKCETKWRMNGNDLSSGYTTNIENILQVQPAVSAIATAPVIGAKGRKLDIGEKTAM